MAQPLNLTIRKASLLDLDAIRKLYYDTVTSVNTTDYSPEEIKVWSAGSHNIDRWTRAITEQHFFVAEVYGEIAGFASITSEGYLDFMYVHKDYQRRGIASALFDVLEDVAVSLQIREIWSHVSITARPFFESRGFTLSKTFITKVDDVAFNDCEMRKQYSIS